MTSVIHVSGIRKTYGPTVAVDDVSFDVQQGEIFGLIGPNGAGKTTTMECVEGLRTPDRGTISVLSLNPVRDARTLQNRVGVQLQQAQLQKRIKVWEAVDLWAALYPRAVNGDAPARAARADRQAQRLVHDALRRSEAAALHRPGADSRSRGRAARRAHHRTRPAGQARDLGHGARHPRPRQDRAADDASDGGGRASVRSRRDHRARAGSSTSARLPVSCASTVPSRPSSS